MSGNFTIILNGLRFFGDHGLYAEEMKTENEFELDLLLRIGTTSEVIHSIEQTINYAAVFELVQREFKRRRLLLETLAQELAQSVKTEFPLLEKIEIRIKKLTPPIPQFTGSVSVHFEQNYPQG